MGEIAEMMLNGDMCECCGVWLDGEGDGFPRYCSNECRRERGADDIGYRFRLNAPSRKKKFSCPDCGKRFRKEVAVADHRRDVHGVRND